MFEIQLNYEKVFETLVTETSQYLIKNNLKAMVLGISGGIDSTVVAAICHEVALRTGIPLIGRSLPIRNATDELSAADKVGYAFCDDFSIVDLWESYKMINANIAYGENRIEFDPLDDELVKLDTQTPIADGNIQARLRMIYLYNLASINSGLVMSTDNQSEYQLGFWTIHGDVGDFDPLQDLWKTEVYGLANYIVKRLRTEWNELASSGDNPEYIQPKLQFIVNRIDAVIASMKLVPTDGLGISSSDLEQIGANSYEDVDEILKAALNEFNSEALLASLREKLGSDVVDKVLDRHRKSAFKRLKSPIYISRNKYEQNFS